MLKWPRGRSERNTNPKPNLRLQLKSRDKRSANRISCARETMQRSILALGFCVSWHSVTLGRTQKVQLVRKKEICIQNIYSATRVRLESSCYDKLGLFLSFVFFPRCPEIATHSATKDTARERLNLNAATTRVASCAQNWATFLWLFVERSLWRRKNFQLNFN